MAKDDDYTVDKDSRDELDEVRKGKPRKFVMLIKGTTIISLVVYKKGAVEKYKKQAKESGTGQAYWGVVDGRGPDITFKLAIADGFEKEPLKAPMLKAFLEEKAEFKGKPTFAIVAAHGPVLDLDDPLVQRFLKVQERAVAAGQTNPDRDVEWIDACRAIAALLEQDQLETVPDKITALEQSLDGAGTTSPTTPTGDPLLKTIADAMKKLGDQITDALKQFPEKKMELLEAVGAVKKSLKELNAGEAQTALLELGRLLKDVRGSQTKPSVGDPLVIWRDAKESCDIGIGALQTALREFEHPDLERIAELGLNGLTNGLQTQLMIAILNLQQAAGEDRAKAAETLAVRAADLRKTLQSDPIVALCEDNPFGITVAIREPLGAALTELERLAGAA